MEQLAGYLNFLTRAIQPGQTFTRRMYAKFRLTLDSKPLKLHHHVCLDQEFKDDCKTWLSFLKDDGNHIAINFRNNFRNKCIIMFCDNQSVCEMVNNLTSGCKNCMRLLRLIVKDTLAKNYRIFVRYVTSKENVFADALPRNQMSHFWSLCVTHNKGVLKTAEPLPSQIWPPEKYWLD